LADTTYEALVGRLAKDGFAGVDAKLRANILTYFANSDNPAESPQLRRELQQLKPLASKAE
jgi:hypothetical protein